MKNDAYFAAERRRRQIAEMQEAEEAAEREAARQKYLEEMRRKPHASPAQRRAR